MPIPLPQERAREAEARERDAESRARAQAEQAKLRHEAEFQVGQADCRAPSIIIDSALLTARQNALGEVRQAEQAMQAK